MAIQPYTGYDSPVNFNGELVWPKWLPDPVCPSCCDCCDCGIGVSAAGIRYSNGEVRLVLDILSMHGFGVPWGHTLAYSSRLPDRIDFGNGFRWFVEQWPRVVDVDNEEGETQYYVAVWSPWRAVWFDVVDESFATRYGADSEFSHDETNDLFKVTTCDGEVWEFNDFDQTSLPGGLFRRLTSKGGMTIEVTSYTDLGRIGEIRRSYTSGGDTTVESFLYTYYSSCEQRGRLQTVTVRRQVNSGSWSEVVRAEFEYYGEDDGVECPGDLKTISVQMLDGSTWKSTGTYYFRYYQCGESNGFCHALKYVFSPASYDRVKSAYSNPVTASDAQVAPYADRYFEYDTQQRVTTTKLDGGGKTFTHSYTTSTHSESYNNWKSKTVETRPGGSQHLVYTNFLGQTLVDDFKSGNDHWIQAYKFNSDYHRTEHASPSAVSSYSDAYANLNVTLNSSAGLIRITDYYSTTGGGAAAGHVQFEKIKKGSSGTAIKLKAVEYTSRSAGSVTIYPVSKETIYRNEDGTGGIDTEYSYTWHTGTVQMEQRTTTLPAVGSSQHGSGTSPTRVERFDAYGNLIWTKDEAEVIARRIYDIPTGAVVQAIADVDTTQVSDEPSGWSTPSGGGLHIVTDFEFSPLGETTQVLGPSHTVDLGGAATTVRTATWTVRKRVDHEVWTAQGYATGSGPNYTYTLSNPVSITRTDANGRTITEIQATRASTSGKLVATDSFGQSSWVRWSAQSYTDVGELEWSRVYHTIPTSGNGSACTNYDQTEYGNDAQGRQNKTKSPGGTITRTVFDVRDQAVKTYVGTNDTGATDSDPTGNGASGNNMVLVSATEYDDGSAGGDGLVTKSTEHVDGGTTRVTNYSYDFRGQQIAVDGEIDYYQKSYYDNLSHVVKVERYNTNATGHLISRSENKFDDRGRVYQSLRYAVDPSTGTVGDALIDRTWYASTSIVIKQQAGGTQQFTKTVHDSLVRPVKSYVGYDSSETSYADAGTVSGDTIFEQTELAYDSTGNVIQATLRRRLHDATGTGELTSTSGSQPKARVTFVAAYHDPLGREIAQANYGDNGGSAFTRTDTVPARSDTVLVSSTAYNDDGEAYKRIDPAGKEDRTLFDDAARPVKVIENYDDGDPTSGAADKDRTVEFTYTVDGQRKTIKARQQNSSDDQLTRYIYGTTLSDSDSARSDLLRAVIYPDSDDADSPLGNGTDGIYDRVEHRYNRQGQIKETKDQNGTVHAFEFDQLGRPTHDRITTLGSGVDGTVRRVSLTYDVRGLADKVTHYDNATIGSGSVLNEIVREYNQMGMVVKEYQEHGGPKGSNTLYVGYNYDTAATGGEFTKGLRLTSLRYPNGRLVHHTYGSSGATDDSLNRVCAIKDDNSGSPGSTLAEYTYLGVNQVVIQDLPEPDIKLDYFGGTSGTYAGIDRFNRVIDQRWYDYGGSADVDRFQYGYDRASNRIWKENDVSKSQSTPVYLDEFYAYDGLDRLKNFDRGELNSTKTGITGTPAKEEDWTLDPLGNWSGYVQKTSGTTDLNQTRGVNQVNEIADISETTGTSWITPAHDKNGNMTTVPRPNDLASGYTCTFDAWNRLVKVEAGTATIATYMYDGLHRRVTKTVDSIPRHLYYTVRWHTVEERLSSSTNPDRQFLWGPLYIDQLILRDRDTSDPLNGTLDERLYALQDANWNVTGLTDTNGDVVERYIYDTYGTPTVMTGSFTQQGSSVTDIESLFGAYRLDREVSFYLVRMRTYHSNCGVWLQRDPVQSLVAINNGYRYSANAPIHRIDPHGRKDVPVTVIIPPNDARLEVNCAVPDAPAIESCTAKNLQSVALTIFQTVNCSAAVTAAYDDEVVMKLVEAFKRLKDCPQPEIHCACCTGPCKDAGAWHVGNDVYICAEKHPKHAYVVEYVRHEFTHHYQTCTTGLGSDCESRTKSEFQASYCAKQCMDFGSCFRTAVWSSCYVRLCTEGDLQGIVQVVYDWYMQNKNTMCDFK